MRVFADRDQQGGGEVIQFVQAPTLKAGQVSKSVDVVTVVNAESLGNGVNHQSKVLRWPRFREPGPKERHLNPIARTEAIDD